MHTDNIGGEQAQDRHAEGIQSPQLKGQGKP